MEEAMNPSIALDRWRALSGPLKILSVPEYKQALADRKEWAEEYAPPESSYAHASLAIRFMHEICGVSLSDARDALIGHIRDVGGFEFKGAAQFPDDVAKMFVSHNG